ncbi:hypothetical protein CVU82_03600 [Candidatus Falkowbacteria bacterium HGW-Falkowbacteria-1]|jgi:hypothetical protein|uniref:Uncharacterized protein n=1 Tax=Candidatus Falkowbacteria bacterium HGW-Falkowbacteria-1 TaxID=2013768 RepID=A0A2N2E8P9_9BACT|nr:MAG: hypothetical protein CVU82_03600 [Candidatus Falkowbacteria bacterium HGW-Falkowbacteria-1]
MVKNFLKNQKIGLILRTFSTKIQSVDSRIIQLRKIVELAEVMKIDGENIFSRIDILVWNDQGFAEKDCGETFGLVREAFKNNQNVFVHDFHNGDIFCSILNFGIGIQLRNGIDYSAIASTEIFSYFSSTNLSPMIEALDKGALATGLAINEIQESVMAGRLANTLAIWHNISLLSVGSFDLRAAKAKDEKSALYLKGWNEEENKNLFYQLAGVEEVIPLVRMVENFGPCIFPVLPIEGGSYKIPDKTKEPELYLRHLSKIGTKRERQNIFLALVGFDSSYLQGGIMSF